MEARAGQLHSLCHQGTNSPGQHLFQRCPDRKRYSRHKDVSVACILGQSKDPFEVSPWVPGSQKQDSLVQNWVCDQASCSWFSDRSFVSLAIIYGLLAISQFPFLSVAGQVVLILLLQFKIHCRFFVQCIPYRDTLSVALYMSTIFREWLHFFILE